MSDMGISLTVEKRRRAQVFSKISGKATNFMKQQNRAITQKEIDPARRDAAAIVMTAFRKFFFIGSDLFDRAPLVMDAITPIKTKAGDFIIKKGDDGEEMFVIMRGILEVMNDDEETVKIQLFHGDLVGEVALVYNEKRMASVRVKEEGTLFSLSRTKFKELQALASTSSIVKRCTWLHRVPTLSQIGYFAISRLAQSYCKQQLVEPGKTIFTEGEAWEDKCILVEGGELHVTVKAEGAKKEEMLEMFYNGEEKEGGEDFKGVVVVGPGSFFGDAPLRGKAGLANSWGKDGKYPLTLKNASKGPVTVSIFTTADMLECLGGGELSDYIADGTGTIIQRKGADRKTYTLDDFQVITFLGQGSFGSVKLVKTKVAEEEGFPDQYALKTMGKRYISDSGQVEHTMGERKMVLSMDHPNVLKVFSTFQSKNEIHILSEFIAGCDLWAVLQSNAAGVEGNGGEGLPANFVMFYSANVVEALTHVHGKGIAFRDLKPENVMVDGEGFLKLIDFGFAKKIPYEVSLDVGGKQLMPKSHTMCGTPEYLAPEFITGEGHDHSVDLWALGVMIHEMVVGSSPFSTGSSTNMTQLFTNIVTTLYHGVKITDEVRGSDGWSEVTAKHHTAFLHYITNNFPSQFNKKAGSVEVSSLIRKLCAFKSFDRLGSGGRGMEDVKNHGHFQGFDFEKLRKREIEAPWIPVPEDLEKWREEEEDRQAEEWDEDDEAWAEWC